MRYSFKPYDQGNSKNEHHCCILQVQQLLGRHTITGRENINEYLSPISGYLFPRTVQNMFTLNHNIRVTMLNPHCILIMNNQIIILVSNE